MSKLFVTDEGHWITINGNHVLINEKGEVMAGMGGRFNGRRISKFQGVPSREDLSNAYGEKGVESDKLWAKKNDIENSKEYKKAQREYKRLDKLLEKQGNSLHYWQPDKYASLVALKEEYASQIKAMGEGVKRQIKRNEGERKNIANALRRDKNGFYTNQTAKEKELSKHLANARFNRLDRETRVTAKANAVEEKYNKMAERIRNKYKDRNDERHYNAHRLSKDVERRGQQLAENIKENARAGRIWTDRKHEAELRTDFELGKTEKKNRALEKFLDRNKRLKLANAAEANKFIANAKGTRVSPLTSGMTGGRFIKPKEEAKMAETLASRMERHNNGTDILAARQNRKWAALRNRQESVARATLAKARPKIAERRQAIRNAVANGTAKKNLEQTHTYNGQPFRVLNYGGNGRNALHSIITKSDEDTAKKYGDAYAARHVETWELDKK